MIAYSLRILGIGVAHKLREPLGPYEPIVQRFRAWPWYCDQNLHINNAQYLTFMDYGRVAWLVRSGLAQRVFDGAHTALVASLGITYRREIRWFAPFELETRALGYEGRWLYVAQTFRQRGKLSARAVLRIGIKGPEGLVDFAQFWGEPSPPIDGDLRAFIEGADAQFHATLEEP